MGSFPKPLKPRVTARTLSAFFNLSLHANATVVAKAPRTTDPNLFRPISLTSVVCMVLEAILKEKMLAHLSQFSLLTSRQHGFLPRSSNLTNLLVAEELITTWFDEGNAVNLIYLDFSNAFESVNHRLFLAQLREYGIAPIVKVGQNASSADEHFM